METDPMQLTALDATFLELEEADESAHMHIGAVLVFDTPPGGRPPSLEDLQAQLAVRLHVLPRFHQRLSEPQTGGLHWPRWTDDERFSIEHHVRREQLPAPAGRAELLAWAGEYFSLRLDRARPLWEVVICELGDGGWAMVTKTHHAMVDGVGSIDIGQTILDSTPGDGPAPGPAPGAAAGGAGDGAPPAAAAGNGTAGNGSLASVPGRVLSGGWALTRFGLESARGALGLAERAGGAALHPGEVREAMARARAVIELLVGNELIAAPQMSLNRPIGADRRLAVIEVELAELKTIKEGLGGTVNDVVLAAAATALRRLMLERGEEPPERGVRAMVPVDIRSASRRLELGNEVTSLFVRLPVAEPDPRRRYELLLGEAEGIKAGTQATGTRTVIDLSSHAPPVLHTLLARSLYATRLFNLTITNVPGPQVPLYAFGSRLRSIWPLVPLAAEHALGLAVFSYDGRLFFCFNADPEAVPELDAVSAWTDAAIAELLEMAAPAAQPQSSRGD